MATALEKTSCFGAMERICDKTIEIKIEGKKHQKPAPPSSLL